MRNTLKKVAYKAKQYIYIWHFDNNGDVIGFEYILYDPRGAQTEYIHEKD